MLNVSVILFSKFVKSIARLRGGGSALPGLIIEKMDPNFINRSLSALPYGVAVISGTNGKTTTTKMTVELLESQGLKVFTNRTGSNFTRGVASALISEVSLTGKLKADIAVLELDEAHAVHFVKIIKPKFCLLLNVMRDQLDRFGEVDFTAKLLQKIAAATTDTVVLNREDPLIFNIAKTLSDKNIKFFGLDQELINTFPSDDALHSRDAKSNKAQFAEIILKDFSNNFATFEIDGHLHKTSLRLSGIYNIFNAAAALTLARTIIGKKADNTKLVTALSEIKPAFGRGEMLIVDNRPLELILVKNPSGFQLALESFNPSKCATMITINDNISDGRDVSWLWDVDFTSLTDDGVLELSGTRAYDMALRLQYDEVPTARINPTIPIALKSFIRSSGKKPMRIYCTYTAMISIRQYLSLITKVKAIK